MPPSDEIIPRNWLQGLKVVFLKGAPQTNSSQATLPHPRSWKSRLYSVNTFGDFAACFLHLGHLIFQKNDYSACGFLLRLGTASLLQRPFPSVPHFRTSLQLLAVDFAVVWWIGPIRLKTAQAEGSGSPLPSSISHSQVWIGKSPLGAGMWYAVGGPVTAGTECRQWACQTLVIPLVSQSAVCPGLLCQSWARVWWFLQTMKCFLIFL